MPCSICETPYVGHYTGFDNDMCPICRTQYQAREREFIQAREFWASKPSSGRFGLNTVVPKPQESQR